MAIKFFFQMILIFFLLQIHSIPTSLVDHVNRKLQILLLQKIDHIVHKYSQLLWSVSVRYDETHIPG